MDQNVTLRGKYLVAAEYLSVFNISLGSFGTFDLNIQGSLYC